MNATLNRCHHVWLANAEEWKENTAPKECWVSS